MEQLSGTEAAHVPRYDADSGLGDSAPSLTPGARQAAVFVDRLQIFNRNTLPILIVHLVLAIAMVLIQRDTASADLARTWLLAIVTMVVARIFLHRRVASETEWAPATATRFARGFVVASLASGLLWGLTAPLFYLDGALDVQIFIVVVLTGMGAGAVTSLVMYMPAFYAFLLPSLLPMAAVAFSYGDTTNLALGVAILVYALALSYFGGNFSRTLVDSLALRYENVDLIAELRLRTTLADEANAAKSRFVATASHDLRQPVHALALFVDALRNSWLDERATQITGQIEVALSALDRMFNSLLDISQLESGAIPVEQEAVQLSPLIEELVNEFTPQAQDKGLRLRVEGDALWVQTDRTLLERILRNLIANAVRYTDEGEVVVRTRHDRSNGVISVTDTGPGISPDDQAFIFEEFRKLDNADRDPRKGLGLGLAIVKRAADLLATSVEVDSVPGSGTTFRVALPRLESPLTVSEGSSAHLPIQPADELASISVMVIDDDPGIRRGMRTLLQDWGCDVSCCAGYDEALRLVDEGCRPQVVIADLRLARGPSGLDAIRALRSRLGAGLPAMIVTGEVRPTIALDDGEVVIHVLQKPAPLPRIRSFLRSVRRQHTATVTR